MELISQPDSAPETIQVLYRFSCIFHERQTKSDIPTPQSGPPPRLYFPYARLTCWIHSSYAGTHRLLNTMVEIARRRSPLDSVRAVRRGRPSSPLWHPSSHRSRAQKSEKVASSKITPPLQPAWTCAYLHMPACTFVSRCMPAFCWLLPEDQTFQTLECRAACVLGQQVSLPSPLGSLDQTGKGTGRRLPTPRDRRFSACYSPDYNTLKQQNSANPIVVRGFHIIKYNGSDE